ncbi:MAG TPA: bacteriohemerythrin [Malonomonas sp.]
MSIIIWKKEYSVGVADIDNDHKKLISMINQLHLAMGNDRGQALIKTIISDMLDYTKMHFAKEEAYMRQAEYLGLLQHFREHDNFVRKTQDLKQRSESGEFVLSLEVVQFLSDWLKNHILETDMKYVPTFKQKGIR